MKTVLQELIDIIESSKQEADIQGVGICEVLGYHGIHDKATELLEKEKEQIKEAYKFAVESPSIVLSEEWAEQYFNETFNQNK